MYWEKEKSGKKEAPGAGSGSDENEVPFSPEPASGEKLNIQGPQARCPFPKLTGQLCSKIYSLLIDFQRQGYSIDFILSE